MKRYIVAWLLIATTSFFCKPVQNIPAGKPGITSNFEAKEAKRVISLLASDEMRGRKVFSPEIDKAADLIASEFSSIGLDNWGDTRNYRQEFVIVRPKLVSSGYTLDNKPAGDSNMILVTTQPELIINQDSGYEIVQIKAADNLFSSATGFMKMKKNLVVVCDRKHATDFKRLARLKNNLFRQSTNVLFILSEKVPSRFEARISQEITEMKLANVLGILPGRSRKDEYVIFSGHYDHIGTGKAVNGDSIYNGANDDASGITAMLLLARYFKKTMNNERTILFVAFTAEESGGYGSRFFSEQLSPASVVAMFNIEMIGTESKWGKNSAFITGFEKTDMGTILQKNLGGTGFTFYPDPYTAEDLFYRSDNATLARLGVPAHTISTAKMENEPHYHKVSDEVSTLDMENMARVIEAISLSATSIINGKDTPSRVNTRALR